MLCLAVAAAIVTLPAFLFPIAPLLDYPNHLARLWLIEGGVDIAPINHFYAENWSGIATNIGIDLVAKMSKGLVPAFVLGQILVALSILLPPLGAVALNTSEFGGTDPWQILFFYFAFALTMLAGFLNFQIGLGTALLCASLDSTLRARGLSLLYGMRLTFGFVIMVIHPFALLFYSALLAGIEFGAELPKLELKSMLARVLSAVPPVLVCLIPIAFLLLWTGGIPASGNSGKTIFNTPLEAVAVLDTPLFSYNLNIDALFGLSIILMIFFAARRSPVRVHAGLLGAAALLAVMALFAPRTTAQSGWLDVRLPLMAFLAALAATRVGFGKTYRAAMAFSSIALTLVILRTAWIVWNWSAGAAMIESMRVVLASVPAGAKVLPVQHFMINAEFLSPSRGKVLYLDNEIYRHFPALMVPWRQAFYPTLFSVPGAHPIKILSRWRDMSDFRGSVPPSVNALGNPGLAPSYMSHWQSRFDYVLVLNADQPDRYGRFIPPTNLSLVADSGFAELFRVRHGDSRMQSGSP